MSSFLPQKPTCIPTTVICKVARSADTRAFNDSCLQFLCQRFSGCIKVWKKIQAPVQPGRIQLAGNKKNAAIAAEAVAADFKLVFRTDTTNIGVLAEGFFHWFRFCSNPAGMDHLIQGVFAGLTDPYSKFE